MCWYQGYRKWGNNQQPVCEACLSERRGRRGGGKRCGVNAIENGAIISSLCVKLVCRLFL